jgi:hypothetical protein
MNIKNIEQSNDIKKQLFDIQLYWVVLVIVMSLLSFFYGFLYTTMGLNLEAPSAPSIFLFSLVVVFPVGGSWLLIKRMNQLFSRLSERRFAALEDAST